MCKAMRSLIQVRIHKFDESISTKRYIYFFKDKDVAKHLDIH